MPKIDNLTLVTVDNVHQVIPAFINERKIIISSYEDMIDVVLDMIKSRHVFNMERDLLRLHYGRFNIYVLPWRRY